MPSRRELAELLYLSATAKPEEDAARAQMLRDALYPLSRYDLPPAEKERLAKLLRDAPSEEAKLNVCRVAIDRALDGTPKKFQGATGQNAKQSTRHPPAGMPSYHGPQRIDATGFIWGGLAVTLGLIFLVDLLTKCQRGG